MSASPCQACGACCASFRVAFYWREAEPADSEHPVPAGYFEDLTPDQRCMKGTAAKHRPKCLALKGHIGKQVSCAIYEHRPSPCRQFQYSYFQGKHNPRCDQARAAHGLPPIRREEIPAIEKAGIPG